jgi:hypothetical protein
MRSPILDQHSGTATDTMVLVVNIPKDTDPALLSSLRQRIEQAVSLVMSSGRTEIFEQADQLAGLVTGLIEPDLGLIDERLRRLETIRKMFREGEWLTSEMLNPHQPKPPANKSHPASDWKRRGRIFSVSFGGKEYFARYQFDALYQPLPIIRVILNAFGSVADSWKIAAWFHFPNGWIAESAPHGPRPIAPQDVLDRQRGVLIALERSQGSYEAGGFCASTGAIFSALARTSASGRTLVTSPRFRAVAASNGCLNRTISAARR